MSERTVWIFHAEGARFASGVFETEDDGLAWVAKHGLTGILTEYGFGGAYDIAMAQRPGRNLPATPDRVGRFSPEFRHVHLVDGHVDS